MSRLEAGSPGMPPESVLAYIEDMLGELAALARTLPQPALAKAIDLAASMAEAAGQGEKRAPEDAA